jgi:hypothetical protein
MVQFRTKQTRRPKANTCSQRSQFKTFPMQTMAATPARVAVLHQSLLFCVSTGNSPLFATNHEFLRQIRHNTAGRSSGHSTETRGKMASNSDRSRRELSHFHACVHCGSVSRRDEFDGTTVATGIYPCSKCGQDGPLNIVIRDVDAAAASTHDPAPGSSAGL